MTEHELRELVAKEHPQAKGQEVSLSDRDQRELDYHNRCRAVCAKMGRTLHGSSVGAGFSTLEHDEVSHFLMEYLEAQQRAAPPATESGPYRLNEHGWIVPTDEPPDDDGSKFTGQAVVCLDREGHVAVVEMLNGAYRRGALPLPPEGHVLTSDGVVRVCDPGVSVTGEQLPLPVYADGAIWMLQEEHWTIDAAIATFMDSRPWTDVQQVTAALTRLAHAARADGFAAGREHTIRGIVGTRSAAEAAKGKVTT